MKSLPNNFNGLPQSFSWTEALKSRPLFVAFDRDGTLVPICPNPNDAKPAPEVISDINRLAHLPEVNTAIVSARSISNLSVDFDNGKTILAGNYGLEIKFPDRTDYLHPEAARYVDDMFRLKAELMRRIPQKSQVILDDHTYSLCVHWHHTPAAELLLVRSIINTLKKFFHHLQWREQPTSCEILPKVDWTKADALRLINEHLLKMRKPELNIYFGDSPHDEHAFNWVNDNSGISVHVGQGQGQEHESSASLRMSSPKEVHDFVKDLVAIRKSNYIIA